MAARVERIRRIKYMLIVTRASFGSYLHGTTSWISYQPLSFYSVYFIKSALLCSINVQLTPTRTHTRARN